MTGTDLDVTQGTELTEQELSSQALAGIKDEEFRLPLLCVVQGLSKAHTEDAVPQGHFVNTLTGEDYGEAVSFVVVYTAKGRFYSDRKTGDVYVAQSTDSVPSNWPDKYAGQRFDELP